MDLLFENVPKILPSWIDPSRKKAYLYKGCFHFNEDRLPDYGGVGVDAVIQNDELEWEISKDYRGLCDYGSAVPALPFICQSKGVTNVSFQKMQIEREKYRRFCKKLVALRITFSKKKHDQIYENMCTLSNKLRNIMPSQEKSSIHVPTTLKSLAHDYINHNDIFDFNVDYMGGCLATTTQEETVTLIHPSGKKLNKIAFTALTESGELNKFFQPTSSIGNSIKLKSPIHQITCSYDGFCYARTREKCYFINFEDKSNIFMVECLKHACVTHIAASSYNPLEYIATCKDGRMFLENCEDRKVLWKWEKYESKDPLEMSLISSCDFGSHPKSVLLLNESSLYCFDLRSKNPQRKMIFSCQNRSYQGEKLYSTKGLEVNPFQHFIASNHYFYVCDERYPLKEVCKWNYASSGIPLYCDISYDQNADVADVVCVLGSQEPGNTNAFFLQSSQSTVCPTSIASPLMLSSPLDWFDTLKFHCLDLDEYESEWLSDSIIGVSVVSHRTSKGFTAFQLTSRGNVFYQDFIRLTETNPEKTYSPGTGCTLASPERIMPHLSTWKTYRNEAHCHSQDQAISHLYVDVKEYLDAARHSSLNQALISKSTLEDSQEESHGSCLMCGLSCKNLCDSLSNFSFPTKPEMGDSMLLQFDVNSLNEFQDTYSKKILEPWITSSDNVEVESNILDKSSAESTINACDIIPCNTDSFATQNEGYVATNESVMFKSGFESSALWSSESGFPYGEQYLSGSPFPLDPENIHGTGVTLQTPKKILKMPLKRSSRAGF